MHPPFNVVPPDPPFLQVDGCRLKVPLHVSNEQRKEYKPENSYYYGKQIFPYKSARGQTLPERTAKFNQKLDWSFIVTQKH